MRLNLTVLLHAETGPLWRWTVEVGKGLAVRLTKKEYEQVARAAEKELERQIRNKGKEAEVVVPEAVETPATKNDKKKWFK